MSGWQPPQYDPRQHQERIGPQPPYGGYPPPQQPPRRKSWPARHKVWSGIIALAVIAIAGGAAGAAGNDGNAHTVAASSPKATGNGCQGGMSPDVNGVCQPGGVAPPAAATAAAAPTDSGPEMLTPGQAETVGYGSQTAATITVESARVTTSPADPEFGEPPANGYYVIVHVKATADPSYADGFDVNELDFYALANGSHYDSTSGNGYEALTQSQESQDLTANLAAGESASGWMAFDVPSRHGKIVYSPNLNGQPLAEWQY